eukprot:bmy_06987T0
MQREGTCKLCDLAGGKREPCLGMGKSSSVRGGNERGPVVGEYQMMLGMKSSQTTGEKDKVNDKQDLQKRSKRKSTGEPELL